MLKTIIFEKIDNLQKFKKIEKSKWKIKDNLNAILYKIKATELSVMFSI